MNHPNYAIAITRIDRVAHTELLTREEVIELLTEYYEGDSDTNEDGVPIKRLEEMTDAELAQELLDNADDIDSALDSKLSNLVTADGNDLGDVEDWTWETSELEGISR